MESNGRATKADPALVRCVVWAKSQPPEALMGAMRRKGVEPIVTPDAFRAMAEVVQGGSMEQTSAILVLVEPSELRGKKAMLISCRRYAPGLRVWVYQSQAPVQLRPIEIASLVPEPEEATPEHTFGGDPSATSPGRTPALRLVEAQTPPKRSRRSSNDESQAPDWRNQDSLPGVSAAGRATDNPSGYRPSGLLTDEELAMLLADDPGDRKTR